jgi:hypothetical protein
LNDLFKLFLFFNKKASSESLLKHPKIKTLPKNLKKFSSSERVLILYYKKACSLAE